MTVVFVAALAVCACKHDSTQHTPRPGEEDGKAVPVSVGKSRDAAPPADSPAASPLAPMPQSLAALRSAIKPWLTGDDTGQSFCASPKPLEDLVALAKTAAKEPVPPGVDQDGWRDVVDALTTDVLEIEARHYCKEDTLSAQGNLEDTVNGYAQLDRFLHGESWK